MWFSNSTLPISIRRLTQKRHILKLFLEWEMWTTCSTRPVLTPHILQSHLERAKVFHQGSIFVRKVVRWVPTDIDLMVRFKLLYRLTVAWSVQFTDLQPAKNINQIWCNKRGKPLWANTKRGLWRWLPFYPKPNNTMKWSIVSSRLRWMGKISQLRLK